MNKQFMQYEELFYTVLGKYKTHILLWMAINFVKDKHGNVKQWKVLLDNDFQIYLCCYSLVATNQ